MKGLVIKDLMCMRKQLIIFAYVVVSVFIVSIMFVLSAGFGNIAYGNEAMMIENSLSDIDVKNISTTALILFMLLPLAVTGDFTNVFKEDNKAGFFRVSASLPLSIEKRVLAKYITLLLMFGMGVMVDTLISFVLSCLTDIISFAEFFGIIISSASVMSIHGALAIVFCLLLKNGSEEYSVLFSAICMITGGLLFNISKVRLILVNIASGGKNGDIDFVDDFMTFIKYKAYILLIIAVAVMIVSYFISVAIAKRKRGVV